MKKIVNTAFFYSILALITGVFYREFTKINNFTDKTILSSLHPHMLTLGMIFFMIIMVMEKSFKITEDKMYTKFYILYNVGLILTLVMLFVRGTTQVLSLNLSKAADMSISGLSGVGHIILSLAIILLFSILKRVK